MKFLHELPDAKQLFEALAYEKNILPTIIEKDYWLMHCIWGLTKQGYQFDLKGGTSLSKGFGIIDRFSEDVDILIYPNQSDDIKTGKNHDKPAHKKERSDFFDHIACSLNTSGFKFSRDHSFDDKKKMRSGGIRGKYQSHFSEIEALKPGILLELGFDQTTLNLECTITSWAIEKAINMNINIIDNRAKNIKCYCPEYTFIEKLQTISTKFRLQQENDQMPVNFLRHYYDIYKLLEQERVLSFIGSNPYKKYKEERFRSKDKLDISKNEAFIISDDKTRAKYSNEFNKKSAIYFGAQPSFEDILERIKKHMKDI